MKLLRIIGAGNLSQISSPLADVVRQILPPFLAFGDSLEPRKASLHQAANILLESQMSDQPSGPSPRHRKAHLITQQHCPVASVAEGVIMLEARESPGNHAIPKEHRRV